MTLPGNAILPTGGGIMPLQIGIDAQTEEAVVLADDALLRHVVILGATGAGKTVLGKAFLEEAVRAGVPVIAVDPQGDLASLALRPTPESAEAHPVPEEIAEEYWARAAVSILTPGSTRGTPVALNPLQRPPSAATSEDLIISLDALAESLAAAMGYDPGAEVGARVKDVLFLTLQGAMKPGPWPSDIPSLVRLLERDPSPDAAKLLTSRERAALVRRAESMTVGAKGLLFTAGPATDGRGGDPGREGNRSGRGRGRHRRARPRPLRRRAWLLWSRGDRLEDHDGRSVPRDPPPQVGGAPTPPRRTHRWPRRVLGPDDRLRSTPRSAEATRPIPPPLPARDGAEARTGPAPPTDARDPERADRPEGFLLPPALAGRGGGPFGRPNGRAGRPPVLCERGDGRARPRGLRSPHVRRDPPEGCGATRATRGGVRPRARDRRNGQRSDSDREGRTVACPRDRADDPRREADGNGARTRPAADVAIRRPLERRRSRTHDVDGGDLRFRLRQVSVRPSIT